MVTSTVPLTWNGISAVDVTVPALSEGTYSAVATVTNSDNVESPASNIGSFIVDKTAPGEDDADVVTAPVLSISEALATV